MIRMRRKNFFSGLLGVLISFCYVAGYSLDNFESLDLRNADFYISFFLGAILAAVIVFAYFSLIEKINKKTRNQCENKSFKIPHFVCVGIMLLCWLPALLSIWPGAFNYDAYAEWQQVAQGSITAHHPVLHVLAAGGLVEGFYILTGSYNVGIAVYTILQMVILANVLAVVIRFLGEFCVPVWLRVFALVFFALSPVVQLFAISVTKDTLFVAAQLLFFLHVIRFYCRREAFFSDRKRLVGFAAASFFTMVLRNNGLYVVLVTLFIMAISCMLTGKQYKKMLFVVMTSIMLLYGLYVGPFYRILDVTAGGVEEMLSVPLQQMARVHRYEYDSLEQEDLELLYEIVSKESLENYRSTVSDFVKAGFNREGFEQNKLAFLKLWLKWLKEYPMIYVSSFLINTVDFWYPHAVVDGYQDAYGKSSFFDYQVDLPGTEKVLWKGAHDYYEELSHDVNAQKRPMSFMILSPGWYLLFAVVTFGYLWCYRKYQFLVPMMILVLSFLTVLLGPIALVRYVLIFYFVFPVLLAILFRGDN